MRLRFPWYRSMYIVPELASLLRAEGLSPEMYSQALPAYIRINRRSDLAQASLDELMQRYDTHLEAFEWTCHLRSTPRRRFQHHADFQTGHLYVQDLASAMAVYALDPRDGETIVDMCAAPGGKTMLISDKAPNSHIIAIEKHERRFGLLVDNLNKYGHDNVVPVHGDAMTSMHYQADRILVDAMCPGDGNVAIIKRDGTDRYRTLHLFIDEMLQNAYEVLANAISMTRPGGVIVYSTCTFDRRFNEEMIEGVVGQFPVHTEPVVIPDIVLRTPLHEHMYRVIPTDNQTKGLFFARLRRE